MTSTSPRFAIAKVIPDLTRMEPRNFGVVVWNRGQCVARFLSDDADADARQLKRLELPTLESYSQWVDYWHLQCQKPKLKLNGKTIERAAPEFIDALCATSLENFQLAPAGFVNGSYPASETKDIAMSLFESVVLVPMPLPKKAQVDKLYETLFSSLANNEKFHRDGMNVPCKKLDTFFPFTFGFGDPNRPEVLMQTVSLGKEDQVVAAAMKFRCVVEDEKLIDKKRCACLISDDRHSPAVIRHSSILSRYGELVNVVNIESARRQLAKMGLPLPA